MNRKTALLGLLSLLVLSLSACEGMALRDARVKDSPEALQSFLQQYPESSAAEELRKRIDELHFAEAVETNTSAAFESYLQLHPQSASREEALRAIEALAFTEAQASGTAEAMQDYLEAHPNGASHKEASDILDRLLYRDRIEIQNLRVEQVNLANNPEGPLDGWGVFADIANQGRRTVSLIQVHIDLLDASGKAAGPENKWWAVAPDLGAFPTPEAIKPPLAPGASRAFRWSTSETPQDWSQKVNLRVTEVRFEY